METKELLLKEELVNIIGGVTENLEIVDIGNIENLEIVDIGAKAIDNLRSLV